MIRYPAATTCRLIVISMMNVLYHLVMSPLVVYIPTFLVMIPMSAPMTTAYLQRAASISPSIATTTMRALLTIVILPQVVSTPILTVTIPMLVPLTHVIFQKDVFLSPLAVMTVMSAQRNHVTQG